MLKKFYTVYLFAFFISVLMCIGHSASAFEFPNKPPNTSFYVDEAGLIDQNDGKKLNEIAKELLQEEKIPLYVVTIPSMITYGAINSSIEQYAQALFDSWGIGFKDRNYGMLLLVSKGDRKARIEFGKGWNNEHNDEAEEIMQSLIIPQFKLDNYSGGILQGVKGLNSVARGLALPKPEAPWWFIPALILAVIAIVGITYSLFKSGRKGWGWTFIIVVGIILLFLFKAAAASGGSGGGFGGGGSGGGGATGSW